MAKYCRVVNKVWGDVAILNFLGKIQIYLDDELAKSIWETEWQNIQQGGVEIFWIIVFY